MNRVVLLAGLLILALAFRSSYVLGTGTTQDMPGLSARYGATANSLVAGEGFVLGGRPVVPFVDRIPGYVVVRAALHLLVGREALTLMLAHGALAAVAAVLAALAARRAFGAAAGWTAGLLVAAWPPLWRSDTQLLETGASALAVTSLVLALLHHRSRPSSASVAVLALLSAAAVALRPDYLLVPLVVASFAASAPSSRRGRTLAILVVLGLPLVLALSWAARNARVANAPFVSVGLGTNLLAAVGESEAGDGILFGDRELALSEGHPSLYWPDPKARDDARTRRALTLIRERPGPYGLGCARRVLVSLSFAPGRLWPGGPSAADAIASWRLQHPGRGRYEGLFRATLDHAWAHPLRAFATLGWGPLLLLLVAGGAWRQRRRGIELATLFALPAYGLLVHVPLHAEPRYMFPFVPVLLVVASGLVCSGGRQWHDGATTRS